MNGAAVTSTQVHEDAPSGIISLSWAFLVIPCIFLVAAFAWIMYNFSQPSEFPQANRFTDHDDQLQDQVGDDEKEQLLDALNETQSHSSTVRSAPHAPSASSDSDSASGSVWKINSKFSTTSRGGSVYTSHPDANGSYTHSPKNSLPSSPKSKRSSLTVDGKPKSVGSKAAKLLALNRDRMMHDVEKLDPIDRQELQRSSSRTSDTRKSD